MEVASVGQMSSTEARSIQTPWLLGRLLRRLRARSDSEHEQAILRIVLVGLITIYMWVTSIATPTSLGVADRALLMGLVGFFALSLVLFASICAWPGANPTRRVVGMLADAGGTTFALFLTGSEGVGLIGVYLFITFGNGFRYGRTYLFACQALCLLGLVSVVQFAPWWHREPIIGWGLIVSLIVLPLYVSTLLKRIHEARSRAEEANRAKSSFLANMSHEMRTPLNGIVGITDLLQTTDLSPAQVEFMRLLRHSVSLLRSLVDDVLDISKIEAGRIAIEIIEFDLHAMLSGLVRLLRPHAAGKNIELRASVDPAIDYRLRGDPHHIRQVLVNLLSNAIKFTERGCVTVSVQLKGETAEGFRVRFEVRDTGIGISDQAREKIFEQFVQADDSTTRRYGGTGLGTTIAKQLVELMGGAIGLTSQLGKGSTFWFELPLLRSAPASADAAANEAQVAAIVVADAEEFARFKPLVDSACTRVETTHSASTALTQLRLLRGQAGVVPAVFVAGDPAAAHSIFKNIVAEHPDEPTAMIYLARTPLNAVDAKRLREVEGVSCIGPDASPRIVRNAIHLATANEGRIGAEVIDLGLVLKQKRQSLRILVAEDNLTNQTIIRQLMESAGHVVILASDGEEALDLYEREKPDLAILDFNMPERSGLEVVAAIRAMEATGTRLPAIILSASVTPETREHARRAGADEFVGKPFDAAVLLQVVDRVARRTTADGKVPQSVSVVVRGAMPLVDRARLRDVEKIARDPEFLGKLLAGFSADVKSLLERLDAAATDGNLPDIPDVTHAIKGAALGIGAQQLGARCLEIDNAAAQGDVALVRSLVLELRKCFAATSAQLDSYNREKQLASV
jgi:two-component system sensor histidine kinase RpfC